MISRWLLVGRFLPVKRGVRFCGVTTSPIDRTMPADRPKHFSMIREFHVADLFTLANAACGVAAVFCAMKYLGNQSVVYFYVAAGLAPAALGVDVLDGPSGRSPQEESALRRRAGLPAHGLSFGGAAAG